MEQIGEGLKRLKLQHMILFIFCFFMNPMVKADSFYAEVTKIKGVATVEGEKLKVGDKISPKGIRRRKRNFIDLKFQNLTARCRWRVEGERKQEELSVYNILAGKVFGYFEKSDKDKHV